MLIRYWHTLQQFILLKESLLNLPLPVNTITYKQKRPTPPFVPFLVRTFDGHWPTLQQSQLLTEPLLSLPSPLQNIHKY